MKLDVLDEFKKIKICVQYKIGKKYSAEPPMDVNGYYQCEPQYEEMDGWNTSIQHIKAYDDLPVNAKKYLKRIEELVGTKIDIISTGPERDSTIILNNPFK